MTLTTTPAGEPSSLAPGFRLKGIDGRDWSLDDVRGERGTVIAFICNHCPYVKAVIDRLVEDAAALEAHGVRTVAIMPNDWTAYPEDAPDRMKAFAAQHGFGFPYLIDASQEVARAYGAVCTPDIFGFDAGLVLRYRGRVDSAGNRPAGPDTRRELREAMIAVAEGREPAGPQHPSIGCSIKWR